MLPVGLKPERGIPRPWLVVATSDVSVGLTLLARRDTPLSYDKVSRPLGAATVGRRGCRCRHAALAVPVFETRVK